MINTATAKTNNNSQSKYLNVGQHKVKINKITARQANSGSYKLEFEVETPPVTTEGFVPAEGYTGQVGTVKTFFLANPDMEAQVGVMIANLADELGVREQVNNFSQDLTYPEYCQQLTDLVKDKYLYLCINGKQYVNSQNGKVGVELQFPRFKAWASEAKVETVGIEKALAKPYLKELPATTDTKEEVLF